MTHFSAFLICLLSFAALAQAMERHQEDLYGRLLSARATRTLRVLGWSGLLLGLAVLVQAQGWGMGLVSYSGHTSLAAALVFSALIVHDRRKTA